MTDLSLYHRPVSNLFAGSARAGLSLSGEQIAFFHDNGYLAGIRVLSDEQVDALRAEIAVITDPAHPDRHLFYEFHSNESADPSRVLLHALGAWRIGEAFHDLLWHQAILVPASQLLGGSVRFWHDQLFCKPAHHGGVVAWHQDYSYWTRTAPMAHLTCWIALDDATEENGCLQYVPGSHRWNLLPKPALAGDMSALEQVLTSAQRADFKPVSIELPRGYASFHHPLMVHGSSANSSARPRRGAVLNLVRDGVKSATDEPLLAGVPAVGAGNPLDGRFFPMLFSV